MVSLNSLRGGSLRGGGGGGEQSKGGGGGEQSKGGLNSNALTDSIVKCSSHPAEAED